MIEENSEVIHVKGVPQALFMPVPNSPNTECPITVTEETNRLCTPDDIEHQTASAMANETKAKPQLLWDGKAAERAVESARGFIASGQGRK